ncbi:MULTISPECIES: C4-dicarboxylate transporter DctA [Sphingobium]|uniref:Aerobic C4-dicarboxylate transport protein n=1 Tax=Sphingobium lignivorans TaxID=2735886 RepID=A0ABR6NB90_9SPHN|nr:MULTISPECIES: C4-dicarboxylate transporter DctA [Sphingobium]MBB5984556.1 aerobic C4-dicarboxylate transport protein [Sphingobium lignivorans]
MKRSGAPGRRFAWSRQLYVQVLIAIVAGVLLGTLRPEWGSAMKPLADGFIKLIKMVIAPVIFLTLVSGIAHMRALGELGRVAARAFGYFIVVSTLALVVGLVVANVAQPGAGLNIDPRTLDSEAVSGYVGAAAHSSLSAFLLDIIPTTPLSALTEGSILQVLFVAVLFGITIALVGEPAEPVVDLVDRLAVIVFRLVALLMRLAPVGAFAAMAYTIGHYGLGVLGNLVGLVAAFYLTSALFVLLVLGAIARANGFSILRLIAYLRSELLLVLGTSSSEAALPPLIARLESAGCAPGIVGLVVPLGYSFNLDGTNIYMTLAALFIAQACGVDLSLGEQIALLTVAVISSKGAAGVTGAGFITLAATLAVVPSVPIAGMALILGIDRFMSECRALTNFIGNAVATIVVAKWEGELDRDMLARALGK